MVETNGNAKAQMVGAINALLADHFALYVKAKNFHWHVSGPHFRDLHLLFDEHAAALQGEIDVIGERARKLGGETITSLGSIVHNTQVADQDNAKLSAPEMLAEWRDDNVALIARLQAMKPLAEAAGDSPTDGLIDDWTDAAQERVWFLNSMLG